MTLVLPTLSRVLSPNYSARGGQRTRLIVIHDCEGSYGGSVSWFQQTASKVSAHLVLDENGARATQMVDWRNKAWHACDFNSVSEGVEAAGYSAKGLGAPEWRALAAIVAFRLKANGLPPIFAVGGAGEGFCQHVSLGKAGGGHHDVTPDNSQVWFDFVAMVRDFYGQPMPDAWVAGSIAEESPAIPATWKPNVSAPARHDLAPPSLEWVQMELNAIGIPLVPLTVDGLDGPATQRAVRTFQARSRIGVDGDAGPETVAALKRAVAVA